MKAKESNRRVNHRRSVFDDNQSYKDSNQFSSTLQALNNFRKGQKAIMIDASSMEASEHASNHD